MKSTTSTVPRWHADLARAVYTVAWVLALPMAMLYLLWRSQRQPEYRQHWAERLGRFPRGAEPECPVIWVHAVSVGETRAAEPLIRELLERWPGHRLLLTHMTPTGRATGRSLFVDAMPGRSIVQAYLPYDLPWSTTAFFRRYQPAVGVIMETELWPNLVSAAVNMKIPLVIANARLSEKSLARGRRFRALLAPALQKVTLVLAQTSADAARIHQFAPVEVVVAGNLKFDVQPDPALLDLGRQWRKRLGRKVVLLASSRDGEEQLVLNAWQASASEHVLLAIVPRHPQRFDEVRMLMGNTAMSMADRRALDTGIEDREPQPVPRLLLGDSMGEMPAWYAMADVVLMGGSFLPHGGQNLIEPCACGVPVIIGESTFNFEQAAEQAVRSGAADRVSDAGNGVRRALELIANPSALQERALSAGRFAKEHRGATTLTVNAVSAFLQR